MKSAYFFWIAIIWAFALMSASIIGSRYFEISKNLEIFSVLYQELNQYYVDETNPNKLMQTAIEGMLNELDPYTNYIPEERIEEYRTQNTGQYAGIGAITNYINDKLVVTMLLEDYPAKKQGLLIGDEIQAINGVNISSLSPHDVNQLMKGQANTKVTLNIKRFGSEQVLILDFNREKVTIKNVPYSGMIDEKTGYLKLSEFTMQAGRQVRKSVETLIANGAKNIILDLRNNPGGLLIEAVNITNVFIPKGKEVVTTKGKITENNTTYKTLNNPIDVDIPLVILINEGSASASEIVAGTLQDYDRAVIVGQKSYGKGLVQITRPLSYNAQLKVTTAKYYTPSGRCIQAIDYSKRNPDGSTNNFPDSLKQSFKTQSGRIVYDGDGIAPDIKIKKEALPDVVNSLLQKGLIFNFATAYYHTKSPIKNPGDFQINDETYSEFIRWLNGKEYNYQTSLELKFDQLKGTAQKEKTYEHLKSDLDQLLHEIQTSKKNDLFTFKDEVAKALKNELVGRYYFDNGVIETSFKDDPCIQTCLTLFNNPSQYNAVLSASR